LLLGHTNVGKEILLPSTSLTTHVVVLGSTGSGKSGLILNITEELNKENIPVILVDIKGDMVNFALQDKYVPVQCITPGATHGEAINVLADLEDPSKAPIIISTILSMIGENPDPLHSRAHAYLFEVLKNLYEPTLENLVIECQEPSISYIGAMLLNDAFPKKERMTLARKLNMLLMSPSFEAWKHGGKLDIDEIIKNKGITIYSVAHLVNKDEQNFAISFLANEVLQWIKTQAGTKDVRLIVGIDECLGLFPPYPANPPTKEPIMKLLKQARAFGVGCILGTQNPVDIDYKALSNCNTWFIGRMTANKDRAKVASGMAASGRVKESVISDLIATLQPRQFIVSTHNLLSVFRTKDSNCDLRGPLVPEEVTELYKKGYLVNMNNSNEYSTYEYSEEEYPEYTTSNIEEEYPTGSFKFKQAFAEVGALGLLGFILIKLFDLCAEYLKTVL
jgi:DNA helicase HerA-like ATPase